MTGILVRFNDLSIGYPDRIRKMGQGIPLLTKALSNLLEPGRLTLLLGENGAGKSTLLRTLAGLIPPLAGTIHYADSDFTTLPPRVQARLRSFVPGEWIDPGPMTLYEFAALGRIPAEQHSDDRSAVLSALTTAGLSGRGDEPVNRISDGERQKGKLARALCQETPVMILDEPDTHLDIRAREEMLEKLRDLAHEGGKTVLFSSHDLTASLAVADTVWIICQKELISLSPGELNEKRVRELFRQGS